LARWFDVLVVDEHYPDKKVDRMASHCLCPIDIRESAKLSGYTAEPDDSYMDYIATKTND
jgi:hypothetical protein